MRKPRSDSKLLNLPEEQQAQLAEWLLGGMPYHVAQATVEKEFGVRVSLGAFSAFWSEVCSGHLIRRRNEAAQIADEIAASAVENEGAFDEATIAALRQKAFELSISPNANPRDVKALYMLVLKHRDQSFTDRTVAVAERNAETAQRRVKVLEDQLKAVQAAVTEARSGGLTPESLAKIEQQARLL